MQTPLCQEIIPRLLFLTLFDSPFTSHSLFFLNNFSIKSNMLVKREAWSNFSPHSLSRFCHALDQLQANDLSLSKLALGFRGELLDFFPNPASSQQEQHRGHRAFFPGKAAGFLSASCAQAPSTELQMATKWCSANELWVYSLSSFLAFGKSKDEIKFQQLI